MADKSPPFRVDADGLTLFVRATPRAKSNAIAGLAVIGDDRTALAVRLTAPPAEGAANKLLCAFLADQLGIPKSDVAIRSGAGMRIKQLHLAGDPAILGVHLRELLKNML